ncbi:sushi, von Willebrand factor type A, EGF and pentraxin domain-containing protein 1-like [Lineus longissimus]|uniref:sushi, von Willebrand factor type A, EGF and pentraxin domain-containing protein 1-like n=1 Tax=Lineus longissimus TaxID=88925 RepID=UPI00315DF4DB
MDYLPLLLLFGFLQRNEGGMPGLPPGGPPPQPKGVQGPGGIGGGPLSSIQNDLATLIGESVQVGGETLPGSARKCTPLKDIRGVVRYSNDTSISTVVAFECKEGFEKVSGDDTRECRSDLTWSGKPLFCTKVDCPFLNIANARANTTTTTFGTVVQFTCISGFLNAGGDEVRRCTADRVWTGKDIQCHSNTCTVPSIRNAISSVTNGSEVAVGGSVTYSCKTGFTVKAGDKTRKCTKMETWSGSELQCIVLMCPALSVPNGILSTTDTTLRTVVDIECKDQYRRVSGSLQRTCVDGQWSGTPLVCKRGRGYQDPPENAATKNCGAFCQGSGDVILVPAGDADGDGFADLVCYKKSGQIHVALNDRKGGFTCGSNPAQGIESGWCKGSRQKVFVTDFDGDKVADLICHSYRTGSKDIRLRDKGSGNSYSNPTIEQSFSAWCTHHRAEFHVADFDGDGKGDLLCHDNRTGYKWLAKGG